MPFLQFARRADVIGKSKPTNEAIAESTALQNDDDFSLFVNPGEVWMIEYHLITTFDADGQIKVAVTTPAGATQRITATMTADAIVPAYGTTTTSGEAIPLVCAAATAGKIVITALVLNSTAAGFINLQWAQNTSDTGETEILAHSYMTAIKLT